MRFFRYIPFFVILSSLVQAQDLTLNQAYNLYQAENFEKALPAFLKIAEGKTSSLEKATALYYAGMIYQTKKQQTRAIELFTKALAIEFKNDELLIQLYHDRARSFELLKQFPQALENYNTAVRLFPKNPISWLLRANLKGMSGDFESAGEDCAEGISLKPDEPLGYGIEGMLYFRQGKLTEARNSFEKGLGFSSNYAFLLNNLGYVLLDLGDLIRAAKYFQTVLQSIPDYGDSLLGMSLIRYQEGNREESFSYFRKAAAAIPELEGNMTELTETGSFYSKSELETYGRVYNLYKSGGK